MRAPMEPAVSASDVKRALYFDCISGCSGDMILGALLDAGLPLKTLEKGIGSLAISGYSLSAEKAEKCGIQATQFKVVMDSGVRQPGRRLEDILELIGGSKLRNNIKKTASLIFRLLGEAEAEIHGIELSNVSFHEIGALDSIIDIIGCAIGFDYFKIDRFYCSAVPPGSGTVRTAHGILPVPAPATLKLLAKANAPLFSLDDTPKITGELVTPTGAAVVTSLSTFGRPSMKISSTGCGAGKRDYKGWPNIMRVWIGEEIFGAGDEGIVLLETNIDDMNPEIYGFLMRKLFQAKADDVWFTPIQMKKNRPAVMLSVLAAQKLEERMTEIILRETSTLGIRIRKIDRHVAEREIFEFKSSLGRVRVKVKRLEGKVAAVAPEYDDCSSLAENGNIPLREVYRIVEEEARARLNKTGSKR